VKKEGKKMKILTLTLVMMMMMMLLGMGCDRDTPAKKSTEAAHVEKGTAEADPSAKNTD
jgi:hypothetical protein